MWFSAMSQPGGQIRRGDAYLAAVGVWFSKLSLSRSHRSLAPMVSAMSNRERHITKEEGEWKRRSHSSKACQRRSSFAGGYSSATEAP